MARSLGFASQSRGIVHHHQRGQPRGTSFALFLPALPQISPVPDPARPGKSSAPGPGTVLVVEGDSGGRRHHGHAVAAARLQGPSRAENAAEHPAYPFRSGQEVDLVFSDIVSCRTA